MLIDAGKRKTGQTLLSRTGRQEYCVGPGTDREETAEGRGAIKTLEEQRTETAAPRASTPDLVSGPAVSQLHALHFLDLWD